MTRYRKRQPELGGQAEVVLQVPGPDDPAAGQAVEVGGPELDLAPGAGHPEQFAGQAVAIVPAASEAGGLRSDLTTVPLDGVEPGHVVLATRAGDRSRLVATFGKSARECLTGPAPGTISSR